MGRVGEGTAGMTQAARRATVGADTVGDVLRYWRGVRRMSQMDVAHSAELSSRHLSFVENGRSRASIEVLVRLGEVLDMPLRERNRLMLAGGYAPLYRHAVADPRDNPELMATIERITDAAEPYPAIVFDRHWHVIRMNAPAALFAVGVSPELLKPPISVMRVLFHPDGIGDRLLDRGTLRGAMLARVMRQARATDDPVLRDLVRELEGYHRADGSADAPEPARGDEIAQSFTLMTEAGPLRFLSTIATFGSPHDVAASELAIETFYPADAETARVLHSNTRRR